MTIPYASQSLNSKDKIVRTGVCPDHQKQSSKYIGVQGYNTTLAWVFKCQEKNGHTFVNYADRSAPTTEVEMKEWMEKQLRARIDSFDKNRSTKK